MYRGLYSVQFISGVRLSNAFSSFSTPIANFPPRSAKKPNSYAKFVPQAKLPWNELSPKRFLYRPFPKQYLPKPNFVPRIIRFKLQN